jgi:hypothetical protein
MYLPGFDSPEFWGFGIGIALLLLGLAYGGWRAGWLSRRERARIDAATLEAQRSQRREAGQQGREWQGGVAQGGAHTVPDPHTRGVWQTHFISLLWPIHARYLLSSFKAAKVADNRAAAGRSRANNSNSNRDRNPVKPASNRKKKDPQNSGRRYRRRRHWHLEFMRRGEVRSSAPATGLLFVQRPILLR